MCVLRCVIEELRIVGGPELPVLDGALVGMSTQDWSKGFERSFWAQFRVEVVEDGEVEQGLAVGGGRANWNLWSQARRNCRSKGRFMPRMVSAQVSQR